MRITMFGKGTFRNYVCTKGGGGVNYGQYCANYLGLKFTSRGGRGSKISKICIRYLCTSPYCQPFIQNYAMKCHTTNKKESK